MRCIFPACDYVADRAFSQHVTLFRFPEEVSLRTAWLKALGKVGRDLEADWAVCSKHFLAEDLLMTRSGRKLRVDAVPINVQIQQEDKLPPYLCTRCAHQLLKCVRFRARCIRTHCILMDIVNDYGYVTLDEILAFGRFHNPHNSDIISNETDSEYMNSDNTCTDLKQEDIIYNIKMETVDIVDHDVVIPKVRSTNDKGCSSNREDNSTAGIVKMERDNIIIEDIVQDDITDSVCCLSPHEGTPENEENDDIIFQDNADNELNNTNISRELNENNVNTISNKKYINSQLHKDINRESNKNNINSESKKDKLNRDSKQNNFGKEPVKDNNNKLVKKDINKESVNNKSHFDNNGTGDTFIDEDISFKGILPSEKATQKGKLSPTPVKEVMTKPEDLNRTIDKGKQKPEASGGLLLSFKLLSCDICNYQTVSKNQLTHHLKDHTVSKVYNCSKCYFLTNSKKKLQFHIKIHCNKKHTCDICNKIFTFKTDLKTHMRIHSGEKPYACNACDKKFAQYNQLKVHLRLHTGEKPYSCSVCRKAFRQKGQLENHLRIHSGEKPYSCDVCNKAFIQRGQLHNHLQTHRDEKPYSCDNCCKSFSIKGGLINHMRVHKK